MSQSLPAVAKSFYHFCKKCNAERYHKVIAHKTARSAKVECEVCHSKSTFSLPKAQAAGASPKATKARTASTTARANSHKAEYEMLSEKATDKQNYSMKVKFKVNQGIQHPKFGFGIVTNVLADKIEICFSDEIRTLVHNRM